MQEVKQYYPSLGVIWIRNMRIPMRDGITLAADVCLPDENLSKKMGWGKKLPAVLEYIPYRKGEAVPGARFSEELACKGYMVVRVDLRGTGDSEGTTSDEYLPIEQKDGFETVEWIARLPWCDGQVNVIGLSYGGFTALQIAAMQPPHLRTIIPIDFTDNRYTDDCHYNGGLLRLYYDVAFYGNMMVVYNALPPMSDGLEYTERDRIWELHALQNEPYIIEWLSHQSDGEYWHNGSVTYQLENIQAPVFMFGGWRDGYPNPPLRLYRQLSCPHKAIIGPWNHSWPDKSIPGPRIDFINEVSRWLDYWCKDIQTGIMNEPSLQVFMQTWQDPQPQRIEAIGEWRAENIYPPEGLVGKDLFLGDFGTLSPYRVEQQSQQRLRYDPSVGITGGLWSGGITFGLPDEQGLDESRSASFETNPLSDDTAILGQAWVDLYTSSTAQVMGYVVNLYDVNEEGVSVLVTKGALNSTRRESLLKPSITPLQKPVCLHISIDATGYIFKLGHRIRLSITHADFPNLFPTPENGMNTVYFGGVYPSRLVLPIVPLKSAFQAINYKPSQREIRPHIESPLPPTWETVIDHLSGNLTHHIAFKTDAFPDDNTHIQHESVGRYTVNPSTPDCVFAEGLYISTIKKNDLNVKGQSHLKIQSSRTHFQLNIELEIYLNEDIKYHRKWERTIPRQYL